MSLTLNRSLSHQLLSNQLEAFYTPFALRLEVSMGSSGFPNGVLGAGTATTDLDLALILIIESEPIAALAIQAHNLNSERSRLFWDSIKSSYEAVRMIN